MYEVIKCYCGEIFAACCYPENITETEFRSDVAKALKEGKKVEMVDAFKFGKCKCSGKVVAPKQSSIFS